MPLVSDNDRRVTVLLPEEVARELDALIPWGFKSAVIGNLLREALSLIRKDGGMMNYIVKREIEIRRRPPADQS